MTTQHTSPPALQLHPEAFARAVKLLEAGLSVHLLGPIGVGKTTLALQLLAHLDPDRPPLQVTCTADTTDDDLLGRWVIDGGDTRFLDGPLLRAMEEGRPCHLDETAFLAPGAEQLLLSLADENRRVWCAGRQDIVVAQPGFRLITSCAEPWIASDALRQRFSVVHLPQPDSSALYAMLSEGDLSGTELRTFVRIAETGWKLHPGDPMRAVTPRLLRNAQRALRGGLELEEAIRSAIALPLATDPAQVRTFMDLLRLRGILELGTAPTSLPAPASPPAWEDGTRAATSDE